MDARQSVIQQHAAWNPDPGASFSHDERSQTPLWDLNAKVKDLQKMVQRVGREIRVENLKKSDCDELRHCDEVIDLFLWKVCLHETQQMAVAAAVVAETRQALFNLLDEAANAGIVRKLFSRVTLGLVPPNVWLYLRAQDKLNPTQHRIGSLFMALRPDRPVPPNGMIRTQDPVRAQMRQSCPLHGLRRRRRPDQRGEVAEIGDWQPERFCRRACDLLLLFELCLRLSQMAQATGLRKSTIHLKLLDCGRKKKELEAKNLSQTSVKGEPAKSR